MKFLWHLSKLAMTELRNAIVLPFALMLLPGLLIFVWCEALVSKDGNSAMVVCPDPACSVEAKVRNLKRGFALRGDYGFRVAMPKEMK